MRILAPIALAALSLPAAAHAQAADPMPTYDPDRAYEDGAYDREPAAPLSERLSDPATQDRLAATVAVLGEVLLDLPIAPMVEPMAELAGKPRGSVDPELTLRKMAPDAGAVPSRAARELPRAMDAMAAMAGGIEALQPALRDTAERLRAALDEARRRAD